MRILKLVFISVIVLSLIVTALSALIPSHVRISRAIDIRSSVSPAKYVSDISAWKQWNKFVQHNDTTLTIEIIRATNDSIFTTWKQGSGRKFESSFVFLKGQNYTTVQWFFDFHLKWYPWEKFQSIIYDKQMGPEMESSLTGLKRIVETSP
ncbi:MAG TPA: hypothetical protein VJT83_08200 [Chitinophagaceae bacterium]|nr:hypothetical protein [Chitinophagaceae bacterium]